MAGKTGCCLAAVTGLLIAVTGQGYAAQPEKVLITSEVKSPPILNGRTDKLWGKAKGLQIPVFAGANFSGKKSGAKNGSTNVTLKSVYTKDAIYFLIQWQDSDQSLKRFPWKKQADGSWEQLKTSTTHDENTWYEDKFAILWNVKNSIKGFNQNGCMVTCHMGEGKAYGNMRTAAKGELGDMWHWKSVRTEPVNQLDDKYLNHTSPSGRHADPKQAGGYSNNINNTKDRPNYTASNQPAPPYWIIGDKKKTFVDNYQQGDEIAGIIVTPFVGDRGDVQTKAHYENGQWTLEIARKRDTGSPYDIQFSDTSKSYWFGVAAFDNTQVRHAFSGSAWALRFEK